MFWYQCVQVASRDESAHRQQPIRQRRGGQNNAATRHNGRRFRHKLGLRNLQYVKYCQQLMLQDVEQAVVFYGVTIYTAYRSRRVSVVA